MSTSLPAPLSRLAHRIGSTLALDSRAMAAGIEAALAEAVVAPDWLPPERRRANHERYARHLLYGDPHGRFSILAIVWDPGQASPVHGHHCWCAVAVYQGALVETRYREGAAGGPPLPVGTAPRAAGSISFDPAAGSIHRLANESGALAVSLHVYGIAPERVSDGINRIYSLT
jgi:predicted metal-dependent enzyme (double-stranded beta helix superfamily)